MQELHDLAEREHKRLQSSVVDHLRSMDEELKAVVEMHSAELDNLQRAAAQRDAQIMNLPELKEAAELKNELSHLLERELLRLRHRAAMARSPALLQPGAQRGRPAATWLDPRSESLLARLHIVDDGSLVVDYCAPQFAVNVLGGEAMSARHRSLRLSRRSLEENPSPKVVGAFPSGRLDEFVGSELDTTVLTLHFMRAD
jgi:hypothetical protein